MWLPRHTQETRTAIDSGLIHKTTRLPRLWLQFALGAAMTGVAGWLLARTAIPITVHTGLSETVVGGLLTGLNGMDMSASMPPVINHLPASPQVLRYDDKEHFWSLF